MMKVFNTRRMYFIRAGRMELMIVCCLVLASTHLIQGAVLQNGKFSASFLLMFNELIMYHGQ